jgi:hypothetical protein
MRGIRKMAYRNKTYICFDADEDMAYYRTLEMWCANENIDFDFYNAHDIAPICVFNEANIKRHLRERMKNSKLMLVLIGEKTKNLYKYVRWEMELALEMDIPIVGVNLNKKNGIDNNLCPTILKGKPVVHVPFSKDAILHAMDNWPKYYSTAKLKNESDMYYNMFS